MKRRIADLAAAASTTPRHGADRSRPSRPSAPRRTRGARLQHDRLRYDMSSERGVAYQWHMGVCPVAASQAQLGNVPYQGHLPSGVWDGNTPPNVLRIRACLIIGEAKA